MNLHRLLKNVEKLTIDNSPAILTGIGVAGTITTAYLTGKASFKASSIIHLEAENRELEYDPPMEAKDAAKLVWKLYIPAMSAGLVTVTAIVGANHVSSRRATALATAYSISEKAFVEYKDKVVEKLGEKKEQAVRDEIAQDRVTSNPPENNKIVITDGGEVLCYDHFTGRYFKSSMETIKHAENAINHRLLHDGYACLSEFYDLLDLPATSASEEVGWNMDKLLVVNYSTVLSPDGKPCISIEFDKHPIRNFDHFAC